MMIKQHWPLINTLYQEALTIRYEVMAGQRGPVTYLVTHSDLDALMRLGANNDEILGVEQHDYSNVAKVAFVSASSPAIQTITEQGFIQDMIRRDVPMLCH